MILLPVVQAKMVVMRMIMMIMMMVGMMMNVMTNVVKVMIWSRAGMHIMTMIMAVTREIILLSLFFEFVLLLLWLPLLSPLRWLLLLLLLLLWLLLCCGRVVVVVVVVVGVGAGIMVEFQIQCGFKFEFMPFLCGVPVPGRGV